MAGRGGDLNLARELQAEFGRVKAPRRRGRHRGDGDRIFQAPSEPQYHQQSAHRSQHVGFNQDRGENRGRSVARPSRPAWQGELVTNDSPGKIFLTSIISLSQNSYSNILGNINRMGSHTAEANIFFHQPPCSLPSTPPSSSQTAVSSAPTIQQPNIQRVGLNSSVDLTQGGARVFGMPMYQTTDHSLPKAFFNTVPSIPTAPWQENRPIYTEQAEEQEDVEMESADYLSSTAPKSTITSTSKGLASSIWNPVNRNASTDSECSSQVPSKVGSDTTKKTPIVTSGITKGPGLQASRWSK